LYDAIKGYGILNNGQKDVRKLPQGFYIIKFNIEEGNFFKKFRRPIE